LPRCRRCGRRPRWSSARACHAEAPDIPQSAPHLDAATPTARSRHRPDAVFNLGNALRLSGSPAAAIPYLQERLRISDFKKAKVQRELDLAQAGVTGGTGGGDTKPGKGHGKAKKG
jgi:hypothetical protein